jgi:hypothetical protein
MAKKSGHLATVPYTLVYDNDNDNENDSDRKEKKRRRKAIFQRIGQTIFTNDDRNKTTKMS